MNRKIVFCCRSGIGWRLLAWLSMASLIAQAVATADDSFEKTVAPIFAAKCVSCHRPDNLKGGFDLSIRESAVRGGDSGAAIVAGDPSQSAVYYRAVSQQGRPPEMPAKGEPLSAVEAEVIKKWIAAGAIWPDQVVIREKARADASFWSFQPLNENAPPENPTAAAVWQANPIDRFIGVKLHDSGMVPNPPAAPRDFLRRATFDLHGLPPTPAEVNNFEQAVRDKGNSKAIEELIERLLDSPRYGEAWGRHWLDVIRFGESRGYERNEIITNLWPFRDYVIQSFNADKPFDQFIHEHLAGDVIGKDRPEIEIGSAFLVAGPYDDVGNQDPVAAAQIRADQMDEMIRATSEAFLGLTLGCARCHDHKFDPLPTADYYSWYATFSGTSHGPREVATSTAREERQSRLQPLAAERVRLINERDQLDQTISERMKALETVESQRWVRPKQSRYLTEENFKPVKAQLIRLVVDGTDSNDPNRKQFKIDEFEVWTDEADSRNVALAKNGGKATGAAHDARDFAGAYSADLVIDGKFGESWLAGGRELVIRFEQPQTISRVAFSSDRTKSLPEDSSLTVFVGDYRIEASENGVDWSTIASSDDRVPVTEFCKNARLRRKAVSTTDSETLESLQKQITELDQRIGAIPGLPVWWVGNHHQTEGPFAVFVGGNPQKRGDQVTSASLTVFGKLNSGYRQNANEAEGSRRIQLGQWLTAADQPLVPRVLVNRIWHYHFGSGIVNTPSDFGYMGGRPSHPELLDWLAIQLKRHNWQLKPLHRLIMTSQTYQQSSEWREDASMKDADDRLLWQFPSRRLSAEEIRDTLLSISGQLDLTMGGPGFRLYEYQQDNVATYVPLENPGPETFRRAVYHHNARAARVDLLTDFDCPDPAFADPRRSATTTPLQALTMMNHGFSWTVTQAFANRLQQHSENVETQVHFAFELAYSRPPSVDEKIQAANLIRQHGLPVFCRALLNSNELINLN